MKVILIDHKEEYAIREIINAFFPKMSIEFVLDIPGDEDYVLSQHIQNSETHTYYAKVSIDNKTHECLMNSSMYSKNRLKETVFEALKNVTGINLPWGILTGIRPSKMVREHRQNYGEKPEDYLISEYKCSEEKALLATEVESNETKHIDALLTNGISLYIGIPFCPTRCLYCSFTSQSVAFSNKLTLPYVEALKKEIVSIANTSYVKSRVIETIYFGGGTPTALTAEQIDDILTTLKENFDLSLVREITFEAGRPDTIDRKKLEILLKHNIKRICINPQTLNNKTLRIIGRNHTSEDFFDKFELARKMGFKHINCDIIAGLPDETVEDFSATLSALTNLNPESITVHTMSIKHGSYLDMSYNMYTLSASNTVNRMLDMAHSSLIEAGKIPYYMYRQKNMLGNLENVGYCMPGHECLYNIYIMEEVQPIIALGAGGSTKLVADDRIERVFNVKEVSEYINRIDEMIERKRTLFASFQ